MSSIYVLSPYVRKTYNKFWANDDNLQMRSKRYIPCVRSGVSNFEETNSFWIKIVHFSNETGKEFLKVLIE